MKVDYIVINFADSDFSNDFREAGKSYCESSENVLKYWLTVGDKEQYEKAKLKLIGDLEYIKSRITNSILGSIISNWEKEEIINPHDLNSVVNYTKNLTMDIRKMSEDEFTDISDEIGYSEWLVIEFNEDICKLSSDVI